MKKIIVILACLFIASTSLFAQKEASDVRKGNREYKKQNFTEAEVDYRRALQTNKDSYEAHYNLGDALYRQEKYEDALEAFETAARSLDKKEDKTRYSKVMHNIGNCHFAAQQYDKAVSAYQESLRANPKDNETRYNLVSSNSNRTKTSSNNSKSSNNNSRTKINNKTRISNSSNSNNSSRTRTRWTKRLLNRSYRRWSKTNKIPKRNCNGSRGRSVA